MAEASFAAAFLVWALIPGLLLASALGLRWSGIERLAGATGLSIALVSFASYGASVVGLPVKPLVIAAVIAAACGLTAVGTRWRPQLVHESAPAVSSSLAPWLHPPVARWVPWLVLILPAIIVRQLEPVWSAGLLVPPTLHDGLDHATWFRLILDTHSVSPSVVLAPPLNPDGSATFYPWGLHAWLALLAGSTTLEPMTVFFRGLVGVSAAVPLSIYAFAARFTGRGWPAMAAAVISLVFWGLPAQTWGWGGYALLAGAVAALPVSRLALDVVRSGRAAGLVAAIAVGVGLLLVHPSQAMAALLITTIVSLTLAIGKVGRWRNALPFLLALAVTGAALMFAGSAWEPLESFLERARTVGASLPSDGRYLWPQALYSDLVWYLPPGGRFVLGALFAIGAVVACRRAVLWPLVVVHLVFSAMVPLAASQTWLTSFWYHAAERLWYLQYACLPVLGALGFVGVFQFADWVTRQRPGLAGHQGVIWPLVLLLAFASVHPVYTARSTTLLTFSALRSRPPIPRDERQLVDFAWIEANVPPGELIFNASADWGLSVPFTGRRTVFWSGGYAVDPSVTWHRYQELLERGDPYTSYAARELRPHGVRYVYAAVVDPRLAVLGRRALAADPLLASPEFEQLYQSSTGAVFRIRDKRGKRLGLSDTELIHFEEGFWSAEQAGARQWRWTNGYGRFTVLPTALTTGACVIRFLGPEPDDVTVSANGTALAVTALGYRLPAGETSDAGVEIIVSSAAAIAPGPGPDDRLLGVRVFEITLDCR